VLYIIAMKRKNAPKSDEKPFAAEGRRMQEALTASGHTPGELAAHVGVSPQAISQWLSGDTKPEPANGIKAARFLGVTYEWIMTGDKNVAAPSQEILSRTARVPLISSIQAGSWRRPIAYTESDFPEWLFTERAVSEDAFALDIEGSSMEPDFRAGDRIIVDPAVSPTPGDFVVAKLDGDDEATFKKYRPKGFDRTGQPLSVELVPLNEDWPVLILSIENPGWIVGTMVEHRKYRRRR
jgi:SOS-response transcriptional repressor LexA